MTTAAIQDFATSEIKKNLSSGELTKKVTPENVFILSVKEGNYINTYHFLSDSLELAIQKGKKYCEGTGLKRRFIHVRPFLTDFDRKVEEEKLA